MKVQERGILCQIPPIESRPTDDFLSVTMCGKRRNIPTAADRTGSRDRVDCFGTYIVGVVVNLASLLRSMLLRTGLECLAGLMGCDPCSVLTRFVCGAASRDSELKGSRMRSDKRLFIDVADVTVATETEAGTLPQEHEVGTGMASADT